MSCVDLESDSKNCGKCNQKCGTEKSCTHSKCEELVDDEGKGGKGKD